MEIERLIIRTPGGQRRLIEKDGITLTRMYVVLDCSNQAAEPIASISVEFNPECRVIADKIIAPYLGA